MLRKTLLPAFGNVTAGQTSVCTLPLGRKIHVIHLELGDDGTASTGNAAAPDTTLDNLITEIRLKINGNVQRVMSGSQLDALNSLYNGIGQTTYSVKTAGTAGQAAYRLYLPIFLAQPWRTNPAEVPLLAWNLVDAKVNPDGINSCQIEVDINANEAGHAPILKGFYEWEPADTKRGIGVISRWVRQNIQAVGTTLDIELNRKDIVEQISFLATTDGKYVNKFKLNANGEDIQDLLDYLENKAILLAREMSPDNSAAPRFDYVPDYDDPTLNAINAGGLSNFTAHVEWSAAANGNMPVFTKYIGRPV